MTNTINQCSIAECIEQFVIPEVVIPEDLVGDPVNSIERGRSPITTSGMTDQDTYTACDCKTALSTVAALIASAALPFAVARFSSDRGFISKMDDPKYWEAKIFIHESRGEMEEAAKARTPYAKLMVAYRQRDKAVEQYLIIADSVTYPTKLRIEAIDWIIDSLTLSKPSDIPNLLALHDMKIGIYHEKKDHKKEIVARLGKAGRILKDGRHTAKALEELKVVVQTFETTIVDDKALYATSLEMFKQYVHAILDVAQLLETGGNYSEAKETFTKLLNSIKDRPFINDPVLLPTDITWNIVRVELKEQIAQKLKLQGMAWGQLSTNERRAAVYEVNNKLPYDFVTVLVSDGFNASVIKNAPDPDIATFSIKNELDGIKMHKADAENYKLLEVFIQEAASRATLAEHLMNIERFSEAAEEYGRIFKIVSDRMLLVNVIFYSYPGPKGLVVNDIPEGQQAMYASQRAPLRQLFRMSLQKDLDSWSLSMRMKALYKAGNIAVLKLLTESLPDRYYYLYFEGRLLIAKLHEKADDHRAALKEYASLGVKAWKLKDSDFARQIATERTPVLLRDQIIRVLNRVSVAWKLLTMENREAIINETMSRVLRGPLSTRSDSPLGTKNIKIYADALAQRINDDLSLAEMVAIGMDKPLHPDRPPVRPEVLARQARETGGRIRGSRERIEGRSKRRGK